VWLVLLSASLGSSVFAPTAQAQNTFRICDNSGCRDVDPNNPPPLPQEPAEVRLIEPEGYRGEPLTELILQAGEGDTVAAYKLGLVYKDGLAGEAVDLASALAYFELAASRGDVVSARHAAILLLSGQAVGEQELPPRVQSPGSGTGFQAPGKNGSPTVSASPRGADDAGQKIIEYLYAAAGGGDAIGLLELGKLIYSGNLLSRDTNEAALLFERAAELGSPDAQYFIGQMHFRGEGRSLDGYQAIKWTRRAANNGSVLGQRALGQIYINGYETIGPDPTEAHRWLFAAAQNGDVQSAELLSLLQSGRYVPGGNMSVLLSAGDMVRASSAAMAGIQELRRQIAAAQTGGSGIPATQTVSWEPRTSGQPGRLQQPRSPGQTTVAPSPRPRPASGGECYIVEHVSFVEGDSVTREEEVCEAEDGSFQVVA